MFGSAAHDASQTAETTSRNGPPAAPGLDADRLADTLDDQIQELLDQADRYEQDGQRYGIETEYPLIDESQTPVSGALRDLLANRIAFAGKEFAAATIELRTSPHSTLDDLAAELGTREAVLLDVADEYGATPLRYGTNPFMAVDEFERSHGERYRNLSALLDANLNQDIPPVFGETETDPRDVGVSGMICSTQVNMQAAGFDDAVDTANHLYAANPALIAVTGNARLFEAGDTGYADIRMPLWEKSCDVRTPGQVQDNEPPKAGKIASYYDDMDDYLSRLDPLFFAPGDAVPPLAQAIGQYWKDVRIKFDDDAVLVENRPISTQPSVAEDIAAHAYSIGRAAYAQATDEDLPAIEQVNRNRYAAMHSGLETRLYDRYGDLRVASDVVEQELDRAAQGLDYRGTDPAHLDPLYARLDTETVPADASAAVYHDVLDETGDTTAALTAAVPTAGG